MEFELEVHFTAKFGIKLQVHTILSLRCRNHSLCCRVHNEHIVCTRVVNLGSGLVVAKTKALISCTVSAKLFCVFVFAEYAKSRFPHDAARFILLYMEEKIYKTYFM